MLGRMPPATQQDPVVTLLLHKKTILLLISHFSQPECVLHVPSFFTSLAPKSKPRTKVSDWLSLYHVATLLLQKRLEELVYIFSSHSAQQTLPPLSLLRICQIKTGIRLNQGNQLHVRNFKKHNKLVE